MKTAVLTAILLLALVAPVLAIGNLTPANNTTTYVPPMPAAYVAPIPPYMAPGNNTTIYPAAPMPAAYTPPAYVPPAPTPIMNNTVREPVAPPAYVPSTPPPMPAAQTPLAPAEAMKTSANASVKQTEKKSTETMLTGRAVDSSANNTLGPIQGSVFIIILFLIIQVVLDVYLIKKITGTNRADKNTRNNQEAPHVDADEKKLDELRTYIREAREQGVKENKPSEEMNHF